MVFPLLLGGLALVGIPILIHLILRQKPKTVPFPAMRFLVQRHRTNLRKLRLRRLLLLLLRMLLLVLICLALTRPRLFLGSQWNINGDGPVTAILLFDTSYSMEYKITGGESRLKDAKKRGLELLEQLPRGSRVAVLDTAEKVSLGKGNWLSIEKARSRMDGLKLQHVNFSVSRRLQDAFELFEDQFRESGGRPRLLFVLSDATKACWAEDDVPEMRKRQDAVPPLFGQLEQIQKNIPGRLALLGSLRKKLPPAQGADYPEQTLLELWRNLLPKLNSVRAEEFPDPKQKQALAQIRQLTRKTAKLVAENKPDKLAPPLKDYRTELLDSLNATLRDTQGFQAKWVDVGVSKPADLALVELQFPTDFSGNQRELFSSDEKFILRAIIQATGQDFNATVVCKTRDRTLSNAVAAKSSQKSVTAFEIDCNGLAPGPHQLQVEISRPDLLDFNNRRFATFEVRRKRQILIITDDRKSALPFRESLEALPAAGLLGKILSPGEFMTLDPKAIAAFSAVFLFNVAHPSPDVWSALKSYADRGGNLCIIPGGRNTVLDAYNSDKTAQNLMPCFLQQVVESKTGLLWDWKSLTSHQLTRRFKDWGDWVDFRSSPRRATAYWLVKPANKRSTALITYAKTPLHPAIIERDLGDGKGRVIMLTTRLDTGHKPLWNNYMNRDTSFFVVFPGELAKYLTGDRQRLPLNFETRPEAMPRINVPLWVIGPKLVLRGPSRDDSMLRPMHTRELAVPLANEPANYQVLLPGNNDDTAGAFSVNYPVKEADLSRVPLQVIEKELGNGAVVPLTFQMKLKDVMPAFSPAYVDLFRWLMLALLLVLALENLLGNLFYRRADTGVTIKEPRTK